MITEQEKDKKIIFFDGVCQLCNRFVDFLVTQDTKKTYYYAPLQGMTAQRILENKNTPDLNSVIYFKNGEVFEKSKAVALILKELPYPWKVAGLVGSCLPRFVSDFFYDLVAKNRYQWFGQKDSCRLPSPEEKAYFLP